MPILSSCGRARRTTYLPDEPACIPRLPSSRNAVRLWWGRGRGRPLSRRCRPPVPSLSSEFEIEQRRIYVSPFVVRFRAATRAQARAPRNGRLRPEQQGTEQHTPVPGRFLTALSPRICHSPWQRLGLAYAVAISAGIHKLARRLQTDPQIRPPFLCSLPSSSSLLPLRLVCQQRTIGDSDTITDAILSPLPSAVKPTNGHDRHVAVLRGGAPRARADLCRTAVPQNTHFCYQNHAAASDYQHTAPAPGRCGSRQVRTTFAAWGKSPSLSFFGVHLLIPHLLPSPQHPELPLQKPCRALGRQAPLPPRQ